MKPIKILLLGKNGQVGWELERTCSTLGELIALDYPEIDFAQPEALREIIREIKPTLIINAAAYTDVDKAEREPILARAVNAIAPMVLAEEARRLNAAMIHFSTDYVFDGAKGTPYVEDDVPNPINIYGATKLEGEQALAAMGCDYLLLRTSWVYSLRNGGFVNKVLGWSRKQKVIRIVDDQFGSPTWARLLAEVTAQVLAKGGPNILEYLRERTGLYHLAGAGIASRFEWAQNILNLDPKKEEQIVKEMIPVKSSAFLTPALRPEFSGLIMDRFVDTFNLQFPDWKESIKICLRE